MSFKKKGAPSAQSLSLHDYKAGTPAQDCSGASAVNSRGQSLNQKGLVIDWPDNPAVHDKDDNDVSSYAYDNKSQSLTGHSDSVYGKNNNGYSPTLG